MRYEGAWRGSSPSAELEADAETVAIEVPASGDAAGVFVALKLSRAVLRTGSRNPSGRWALARALGARRRRSPSLSSAFRWRGR